VVVVVVAEGVVLLLLALLVAGLLRSHAEILRALHDLGVPVGDGRADMHAAPTVAPPAANDRSAVDLNGETPAGEVVQLAVGGGRATLLAFLTSGCTSCLTLWSTFVPEATRDLVGDGRVVLVTRSVGEESPAEIARLAPDGVTTVMSGEAWVDYAPPAVPYFVLVDESGRVAGEGSAPSWDRVADLLRRARADAASARALSRRDLVLAASRDRADRVVGG